MGLYLRGSTWWYSVVVDGRQHRQSTGTSNRKLAEKVYAKAQVEVIECTYLEKQRDITFAELTERYMAKYQKQRDDTTLKHLLPVFGEMNLSGITAELVEDHIISRSEAGAAGSTIYQEYALGRRMFNVARKKWKLTKLNPFADVTFSELVEINNSRERWLTDEEEALLIKAASPDYLRDVIIFALHTGCRRGEILSAKWKENVDMQRRLVTVQATKHGNKKAIPMSETLSGMLLKRSRIRHISGAVFPVVVTSLKDAFERAVVKAGLEDFHFHDLRHTFATRLVQAGVDLYAVKQMMGHKSIKTTERYAHHYPESLRAHVRHLDRDLSQIYHNGDSTRLALCPQIK